MTTDDNLRDLAKDLPWERPTSSRRDALRSSLLVEAAESTVVPATNRRWLGVGVAFAAGVLAAAAVAVIIMRREPASIDRANLAQVTSTSPDARLDHRVVTTETGLDEIVHVRDGKLAISIPAQRRGDRVRIQTSTAEVEGDAGELEVVVVREALQSVTVKTGTARVIAAGQTPVMLSAGQTWRASIITADLSPAPSTRTQTQTMPSISPTTPTTTIATPPAGSSPATSTITPPATPPANADASAANPTTPSSSTSDPARPPSISLPPAISNAKPPSRVTSSSTPSSATTPVLPSRMPPTAPVAPTPDGNKPALVVDVPALPPAVVEPVRTKPASIERRFQTGWALLRAGKAREAATELGAAADAAPDAPLAGDARYFQAVALVRANDPRAAERVLVQFLDTAPKSLRRGRAAVLLGRLLAERGDRKSARAWLETAAADPDPAIAAAARAGLQALE